MENIDDIVGKNIINRTIIENEDLLLGTYVLENGIPVGDINNSLFKMNITSTS